MKNLIIFILIIITFGGCSDPIGEVFFESESSFVQGEVTYVDVQSGDTIRNQSNISSSITYQDGRLLSTNIEDSTKGAIFQFGPLPTDNEFTIYAEYYDTKRRLLYTGTTLIDSLGDGINVAHILLRPSTSKTSISGSINYTDIITQENIADQSAINIELIDTETTEIQRTQGSDFHFDSLKFQEEYRFRAHYQDTINHLTYSFDTVFMVSLEQILIDTPIKLKGNHGVTTMKGSSFFIDPPTGITEIANTTLATIKFLDPLKGFSDDVTNQSNGSNFSFGPLEPDVYIREFYYQGDTYSYHYADTIEVTGETPIISEEILLEREKQTIMTGQVFYTDPTTGIRNSASEANGEIAFMNQLKTLSETISTSSEGSDFTFGPLGAETYTRNFSFTDGLFNYTYSDTVVIDGVEPVTFEEIDLIPVQETLLSSIIKFQHPISEAVNRVTYSQITIAYLNPLKTLDNGTGINSTGSNFSFGPLEPDDYTRTISFSDGIFDYEYMDTLTITGNDPILFEEITLPWKKSTGLIVRVTDQLGNSLSGANIYLYKNYNFLLTYLDDPTVAIAHGVTGEDGSVTFSGLDTGNMYVYATMVLANDTIDNISSNSTPISLVRDIVRTVNTFVE